MFYPRDQQSLCCFLLFQDLKILWLLSSSWYAKECYTYTVSLMMACYYLLCTKIHIACQVSVPEISVVWSSILYEQRIFKRGRIVVVFLWLIFSDEKSPSSKLWTVNTDPLFGNWDVFLHSLTSTSSPGWALNLDFTKQTGYFCRLFWRKTYILDCLVELYIVFQVVLHSFRSKLKGFPLTN